MLDHFKHHKLALNRPLTKLDNEILEAYFFDPKKTIYDLYVSYRSKRRKSLPYFQSLLKGLDKNTPSNRVAYLCVELAVSDGNITREEVIAHMRDVFGEVVNERTGKREIDAPISAYADVERRIHRLASKRDKVAVIHREALPATHGKMLLGAYAVLAKSADQLISSGMESFNEFVPLTPQQKKAGATMVTQLMQSTHKSVRLSKANMVDEVSENQDKVASRTK